MALQEMVELKPTIATRAAIALVTLVAIGLAIASQAWWLAVVSGLVCAIAWIAIGRRRIFVDEAGVRARGVIGQKSLRWAEIEHYTYYSALAGGLVRIGPRDTRIRGNDASVTHHVLILSGRGTRIRIDSHYRRAEVAVPVVLERLHAQLGSRASFSPFAIADDGLHHSRAGVLPWAKVEEIQLDGQNPPRLNVIARGKSFPWRAEPMSRVHNGLLLVERLAERGISIDLGRNQAVHDRLHDLLERAAALPRADVVKR